MIQIFMQRVGETNIKHSIYHLITVMAVLVFSVQATTSQSSGLDQNGYQWYPYLEWSVEAPSVVSNHFDVIATVVFTHGTSGETRQTDMFYTGGSTWKFRFTGTQIGQWSFSSTSSVSELNGLSGVATISPNPDPAVPGFVTHFGDQWGFSANQEAFVPQLVMVGNPQYYFDEPSHINSDIQTFLVGHGFNGFHIPVYCRWFDITQSACDAVADSYPDTRTFDTLESLISQVYAQGGMVHIWLWGDNAQKQNPGQLGGINGVADQRLQRYIAARLGPIPGWTIGYGFDLWEWVTESELDTWHNYVHSHMGWDHLLGARGAKNELTQLSELMDYSSYEQHSPDYDLYVQTITARPQKPSFSEDRFRIRTLHLEQVKDYTPDETRRGLWHSTMAGGVANIWGNVQDSDAVNQSDTSSLPYPNDYQIKTYSQFFANRFLRDMERCNSLTDGYCLGTGLDGLTVFYKEDANSVLLDLSSAPSDLRAIAVDTKLAYAEIDLGVLSPSNQSWQAPYISDWAIAVQPSVPVQIISTPSSITAIGQPYSYDVHATGDPAPTFSLTQAPTGMTIDPASGVISWTPTILGQYPVSILANNGLASATQSFTLHVTVDGTGGNQPPTTIGINSISTAANPSSQVVNLFDTFEDHEDTDTLLSYGVQVNSNPALVNTTINHGDGILTVAVSPNMIGNAAITVRATDTGGLFVDTSFTVQVNDVTPPIITLVDTAEVIVPWAIHISTQVRLQLMM